MAEYIDRDTAIKALCRKCTACSVFKEDKAFYKAHCAEIRALQNIPAADVKPVVKGRWISRDKRGSYVCSICGDEWVFNPDHGGFCYCPHCGADMREGEEE